MRRSGPRQGPSLVATASRCWCSPRRPGFRHASIDDGVAAIRRLGTANGFTVDVTQDPERIQDATLKGYRVVVFLS